MWFSRLCAVKDGGRKTLFTQDNLFALIFVILLVALALVLNYGIFAYFTLGAVVVRVFEVIFELKGNILDKPFLSVLIMIGVPSQFLWTLYR